MHCLDVDIGREEFADGIQRCVDVDEAQFVFDEGNRKVLVFHNNGDTHDDYVVASKGFKSKPPSILVIAGVTAPRILNPTTCGRNGEKAEFDPFKKGVVFCRRVRGASKYKRSTANHAAGSIKYEKIMINGRVYRWMMAGGKKSMMAFLEKYYDFAPDDRERCTDEGVPKSVWGNKSKVPSLTDFSKDYEPPTPEGWGRAHAVGHHAPYWYRERARATPRGPEVGTGGSTWDHPGTISDRGIYVQQDSAGGHGFDNFHGGEETFHQVLLERNLAQKGITLICQPKNSPSLNMCDGGFWNSIKADVSKKMLTVEYDKNHPSRSTAMIEQKLWEAVKESVENFEAKKLWNIACQKQATAKRIIELNGESVLMEPHTGIRKEWGTF